MSRRTRTLLVIAAAFVILLIAAVALILILAPGAVTRITERLRPPTPTPVARRVAVGISVAPHLPSRPDLLAEMGMTWVKVYATDQIGDYPDQHVLYRIDVDPGSLDDWERGLPNLAAELAARGADAVEIGNEPNLAYTWQGQRSPDAAYFTAALCRAYRAFKAAAPQMTVVAGGLAPAPTLSDGSAVNDLEFAQAMFDAGAGGCFDAWAYHPYGFDQPPEADPTQHEMAFRRAERMHEVLANNGHPDSPIWITEFGWLRDPAESGLDCTTDPAFAGFSYMIFPRDVQADYTARAIAYASRHWPWVGPMFVWNLNWNLYDASYEAPCSHLRWYAILDADGAPLPAVRAIQDLRQP
jgi:hypothetical protein